jgi:enoyl-CoA hydratase
VVWRSPSAATSAFANEGARFGIPAARHGLGYGASGVSRLMELVGPSFTKEIFFTARHFSAVASREMGLVKEYTSRYCATIAENAPMTMHALKRNVGERAW